MITRILALIAVVGSIAFFTGCRTAEGFGEDMEKAGEKIQDKVD
jgi:predicted small secreted protein